jgi:thiamine pyrophosphate-dependent acetolactate synthase large subunit-like protein
MAVPGAVAAKNGVSESPRVTVTGDGGFVMNSQVLADKT